MSKEFVESIKDDYHIEVWDNDLSKSMFSINFISEEEGKKIFQNLSINGFMKIYIPDGGVITIVLYKGFQTKDHIMSRVIHKQ